MQFPNITLEQIYTSIFILLGAVFIIVTILFLIIVYAVRKIQSEHYEIVEKLAMNNIKWSKDGDQYFVYSNTFTNLQESDCTEYAFGYSLKEAAEIFCEANGIKL